jgi:hypothetical protein
MRCGRDETRRAPRILIDGKGKYYDPLDHADGRYEAKMNYIK